MSESTEHSGSGVRDAESCRQALDAWMRRQHPELEDLHVHDLDMPSATGFSNETVFFSASWSDKNTTRAQRYVARIEPEDGGIFPTQTPATAVSVKLQHRIMNAVAATGVAPIPPTLPFEGDLSVLGRPFFVMEYVPGAIPAEVPRYTLEGFLVDEATPAQRERMVQNGLENMAALHRLDWQELGLDWLDASGEGKPSLAGQLALYRDYTLRELAGREHPVMMHALDWLEANEPELPVGLSWGDARLGNMIWQDYRCAAILDWEAAALAPPETDIGWWVMFDRMSFDDMDAPRLEGFPTREEMVAYWEDLTGRRVSDIRYWEIFGAMRFCAIFIKLGDRFVRAGLAPAESNVAIQNLVSDALARLLGIAGA
jgi:aminoglycoside phosphotransferase (APT) family kinase protein